MNLTVRGSTAVTRDVGMVDMHLKG